MKLKSLRARITIQFALLITIVVVVIGAFIVVTKNRSAVNEVQQFLPRFAQGLSRRTNNPDWLERLQNPPRGRPQPFRERNPGIIIMDDKGTIFYQSRPDLPDVQNFAQKTAWFMASDKSGPLKAVVLVSKADTNDGTKQIPDLLILGASVIAFVMVGTWFMVGSTLSPINKLAQQAASSSTDTLNVALTSPSGDREVVNLVTTLNDLLGRLAKTAAEKGRFYAAASHELRTPIQALSGHLETALSRQRSEEEYEISLQEAQSQTRRLTSLVQDLLLLHQLEGNMLPPIEDVDVKEAVEGVLEPLGPLIEAKEMHVCPNLEVCSVKGPSTHVQIMVRNIIENAAKYGKWGGEIVVVTTASNGEPRLVVFNESESQPDWNSPALKEAFYKGDEARTSGGNGLGLAICRAIAAANKWKFEIKNESNGVVASVWFTA